MFHFVVHYAYFSCMSCFQEFTLLNIDLTTLRILKLYIELKVTFGVIVSWAGRIGSVCCLRSVGRVGSEFGGWGRVG